MYSNPTIFLVTTWQPIYILAHFYSSGICFLDIVYELWEVSFHRSSCGVHVLFLRDSYPLVSWHQQHIFHEIPFFLGEKSSFYLGFWWNLHFPYVFHHFLWLFPPFSTVFPWFFQGFPDGFAHVSPLQEDGLRTAENCQVAEATSKGGTHLHIIICIYIYIHINDN